jgi:hypothetical protein
VRLKSGLEARLESQSYSLRSLPRLRYIPRAEELALFVPQDVPRKNLRSKATTDMIKQFYDTFPTNLGQLGALEARFPVDVSWDKWRGPPDLGYKEQISEEADCGSRVDDSWVKCCECGISGCLGLGR